MAICEVCKQSFRDWHIDDHLHLTNWSLPSLRTAEVCSDECQQILISQYEIEQRIKMQQNKGRIRLMNDSIERVSLLLLEAAQKIYNDDDRIHLYYNLRDALDLDED